MSKEKCPLCGSVFPTTHDPNAYEGWFLSKEVIDNINVILNNEDFYLRGYIKQNCTRAIQCPTCGKVISNDLDSELSFKEKHIGIGSIPGKLYEED